ncbi:MAG: hypothetical protein M4D80_24085 [Myxococcota bacterium]|nr:hypothetical protein [Deltaproteobacteria bacterium]MDQ3338257.1 hypothetical protein [Myxococcota bacterium]
MAAITSVFAFTACTDAEDPDDTEVTDAELAAELASGKADGVSSAVITTPTRVRLFGAAARQLYVLMEGADATATTGGGFRLLRGPRTACVSNGLATYCELAGTTDDDPVAGFDAGFHGNRTTSAAAYVLELLRIKAATGADDVSVPWFRCVRTNRVWCGVETARELVLDFTALPALGASFVYEGWAIKNGATTTDRFVATTHLRQLVPSSLADATAYVLTIEPRYGDVPAASDTHILAGALVQGAGALTTAHPAAFGTDFSAAAARYVLATPSSAATNDNNLGIWFVDPAGTEALMIPTLPTGWIYEGWVVNGSSVISTGRFRSGVGADSDGAGPTAGPLPGPMRPGQDFINPPMSLIGLRVAITVEPEPDDAAAPFAIRPLTDATVEAVAAPATQTLANTSSVRPSGAITLH